MQVNVLLFAGLRETLGESLIIEIPSGSTVSDLLQQFAQQQPQCAPLVPSLRVAIDQCYAQPTDKIDSQQEIALIPPVSGG